MSRFFFILFLMFSSSTFAGIGDKYYCKIIDGALLSGNKPGIQEVGTST